MTQRLGKFHGVVEYVSSGSRLKVFVPKETCMITVVLAGQSLYPHSGTNRLKGLSCPKSSRPNEAGEPYGDEAMQFTRSLCMQREVRANIGAFAKLSYRLKLRSKQRIAVAVLLVICMSRVRTLQVVRSC